MKQILFLTLVFLLVSCGGQAAYRNYIMVDKGVEVPINEQVDSSSETDCVLTPSI